MSNDATTMHLLNLSRRRTLLIRPIVELSRPIRNVLVVGKNFVGMLSGVHASIRFDLSLYRSVHPNRQEGFAPSRRLRFNDTHGMAESEMVPQLPEM
jgi:hypothetical protein